MARPPPCLRPARARPCTAAPRFQGPERYIDSPKESEKEQRENRVELLGRSRSVRCPHSARKRPRENRSLEPTGQLGTAERFLTGDHSRVHLLGCMPTRRNSQRWGTQEVRLVDGSCAVTVKLRT